MSLHAQVCCDCLERRQAAGTLPPGVSLKVELDGMAVPICEGIEIWEDHPRWNKFSCEHETRALLHHRLGNISLISLLRAELARAPDRFPILLTKVLYSGSHGGDHMPASEIPALLEELEHLSKYHCTGNEPIGWHRKLFQQHFGLRSTHFTSNLDAQRLMETFRVQMQELAEIAKRLDKPILF